MVWIVILLVVFSAYKWFPALFQVTVLVLSIPVLPFVGVYQFVQKRNYFLAFLSLLAVVGLLFCVVNELLY